jgi:hypothetical protein
MAAIGTTAGVVFLAVSRREKAAVVASADLTDAKLMADAGLARAQGEVISHILATTNVGAYDFLVSTNYLGPAGSFRPQAAGINVTNVGYWLQGQDPNKPTKSEWFLSKPNQIQTIANLMYDPRPPVYIRTTFGRSRTDPNYANEWDFRFYLDLNRNGLFEDTSVGRIGDPQWIGILEHPDRPHSETNRFIGRYAFLALPAGKIARLVATMRELGRTYGTGVPCPMRSRLAPIKNQPPIFLRRARHSRRTNPAQARGDTRSRRGWIQPADGR